MNFNESLEVKKNNAESILFGFLPEVEGYQEKVLDAMRYSVMAGGKRLRPVLMNECYKLFGGKKEIINPFMAAIEMIHTYSLVHDDLPAMDNDEYRRGKLTTWKKYDEAIAILAGDGLLNYAFETASKAFDYCENKEELKSVAKAIQILSAKAGVYGMIGGQTADVVHENESNATEELLIYINKNKTAALIEASMMIGAVLANASEKDVMDIENAAYNIGLAFQIQDDILDVTGTYEELGKPIHSDEKNQKTTYVSIYGLDKSGEKVKELSEQAISIIRDIADENRVDGSFLMTLVETLINRKS